MNRHAMVSHMPRNNLNPADVADTPRPKSVYLDTWVWIELAKADRDGGPLEVILEAARRAVREGLASFPLSPVTYQEHMMGSKAHQREQIGSVMYELSQGASMVGASERLLDAEVERAMARRFGPPFAAAGPQVFGTGIGHAFGDSRAIEAAVSKVAARTSSEPGVIVQIRAAIERSFLCNADRDDLLPGPRDYYSFDLKFVLEQDNRASALADVPKVRWRDAAYASKLVRDIFPAAERVARKHSTPLPRLGSDAAELTAFLRDVPTLWTWTALEERQRMNPQRRWERQDHHDLAALSVALVYCDIVVPDKHWGHIAKMTRLDLENSTCIVRDMNELPKLLFRAAA